MNGEDDKQNIDDVGIERSPSDTTTWGGDDVKLAGETRSDVEREGEHDVDHDDELHAVVDTTDDAKLPARSFAKVEKSLAGLGFFTPSSSRIKAQQVKRIHFTREVDGKRINVSAEILPTSVYGLPITADLDKYLALAEIITRTLKTGEKISNPIRFTSAELLRLLNTQVSSGKNYKDISDWLDVMTSTTIISDGVIFEAGKKRFGGRDRFHVFDRAVTVGKELPDGTIADANYVWLSSWQLENINHNWLLPIELETYRKLKNHIAKSLVPLLQVWLYASHKVGTFEKSYDALCEVLSITRHRAPSLITRQLKPSLDELTEHEYLKSWRIEKTSDRKSYKITLFHGPKFHRDRRRRAEQKETIVGRVIAESRPVEPRLPELGKIDAAPDEMVRPAELVPAALNVDPRLLEMLASRGIIRSTATSLLAGKPADELLRIEALTEYWDRIPGERTAGLLVNLIRRGDPTPAGFESSRQRAARLAEGERLRRMQAAREALQSAYERHLAWSVDGYIADELPREAYDALFQKHHDELSRPGNFFAQYAHQGGLDELIRLSVRAEIRKTLSLISFAEFCQREGQNILAPHDVELAALGIYLDSPPEPQNSPTTNENPSTGETAGSEPTAS